MSVADIGETAVIQEGDLEEKRIIRKVLEGKIDGVEYKMSISCSVKVTSDDEIAAECTKCGMVMKRSKCMRFQMA